MLRRHLLNLGIVLVAIVIICLWLWQPARQVRRHGEKLISAVESKDWEELSELMTDDYSDRWGHDKAEVIERSKQVFSQFFVMEIKTTDVVVEEGEGLGTVTAQLTIEGRGGPLAELVVQRAATLRQPFTFEWRQRSWKPWDWGLTKLNQPELEMVEY